MQFDLHYFIEGLHFNLAEWFTFVMAGFAAGIVNTLAGGGSIFTLSALLFYGVPAPLANGSNRLGILVQNVLGTHTFHKSGLLKLDGSFYILLATLIGAIAGALVAADIDKSLLEKVVGFLMLFVLANILMPQQKAKVKKKINKLGEKKKFNPLSFFIFLLIGFYGGFVQAGIGILMIVALSKLEKMNLVHSNALKMVVISLYSLPVFFVFLWKGQVDWVFAILLALGQIGGTWFAGKYVISHPQASTWVKWLLILMVTTTIFKMFHLYEYLPGLGTP
ncbi:sulfite exporter TauE/SafE family protein [Sediminitomix flava]|uniref:Probable membrane transporter protein n=1 Tax=Sediminitomix flava TaxID=379075 RepID=A0A315ZH23_SEDFL|nr:sulfite exporter TauE/SafE family protein [Sediminitomix flava]PWJ44905.1 hypothetical protein BC781_1011294 [Sediminitomix flava]